MYLTLYISSNCKSPIIYDFEFFLRVRSQSQVFVVFAVKGCQGILPRGWGDAGGMPGCRRAPALWWGPRRRRVKK